MDTEQKKFNGWLWAVKLFGKYIKIFNDNTKLCPKSWRHYYDEGLRADQAVIEDLKHS